MKLKNFSEFVFENLNEMSKIDDSEITKMLNFLKSKSQHEKNKDIQKLIDQINLSKLDPYKNLKDIKSELENGLEKIDLNLWKEMPKELKESLWQNIWDKRKRGEKPARPGSEAYKKAVDAGRKINKIKESEINSDVEFKEYAKNILKKAHGEDYDDEEADEVIADIIGKVDGNWGRAIGILTSGLGESTLNEAEESYNDYPESARNAARKAIAWRKKYKDEVKAGTRVGWTRASQLANGENLSLSTVKRMKAFFDRHEKNKSINPEYKSTPWKDNGYVSHLLWGGDSARNWAERKIKQHEINK